MSESEKRSENRINGERENRKMKTSCSNKINVTALQLGSIQFSPMSEFKRCQFPTKQDVIQRILHLVRKDRLTRNTAAFRCANELREIWIASSVYPMTRKNIQTKIRKMYDNFIYLCNPHNSVMVKNFNDRIEDFSRGMLMGFDIKSKDPKQSQTKTDILHGIMTECNEEKSHDETTADEAERDKCAMEKYGFRMTPHDKMYYHDQCFGEKKLKPRQVRTYTRRKINGIFQEYFQGKIDEKIFKWFLS